MADEMNTMLEMDRSDLSSTRLVDESMGGLAQGAVRLRVDRFAVTANTITYAVMGDMLGYWDFYPADGVWGRVPAMGWADVVVSNNPDIEVGGRYYGWFPMAKFVDVLVTATADGMRDDGEHRLAHAAVYRSFSQTTKDPLCVASTEDEDRHALLRGLFATGYLADEFFADEDYYGADDIIVLSASSKTAIGFAQCAAERGRRTIGVTSPGNVEFVRAVGFYDLVVTYTDVEALAGAGPDGEEGTAVSIDMAGDSMVLSRVHDLLGDRLRYSMTIGMSHHDAPRVEVTAGPTPTLFFAPTEMARRSKQWGRQQYQERLSISLGAFVEGSRGWLRVDQEHGGAAAQETWENVYRGRVAPSVGKIVSLHGSDERPHLAMSGASMSPARPISAKCRSRADSTHKSPPQMGTSAGDRRTSPRRKPLQAPGEGAAQIRPVIESALSTQNSLPSGSCMTAQVSGFCSVAGS